jgi:hypothetical protein
MDEDVTFTYLLARAGETTLSKRQEIHHIQRTIHCCDVSGCIGAQSGAIYLVLH